MRNLKETGEYCGTTNLHFVLFAVSHVVEDPSQPHTPFSSPAFTLNLVNVVVCSSSATVGSFSHKTGFCRQKPRLRPEPSPSPGGSRLKARASNSPSPGSRKPSLSRGFQAEPGPYITSWVALGIIIQVWKSLGRFCKF